MRAELCGLTGAAAATPADSPRERGRETFAG